MTDSENSALAPESSVILRWEPVLVDQVITRDRDRGVSPAHVDALKSSFALLGGQLQLQPIVLDSEFVLIDGAHRLEAAKQSNWSHIAAVIVTGASQIDRSLIEAEANRVRRSLSVLELEAVWRTLYEPELRAAAKRRQLDGLRQRSPQGSARGPVAPVIGISNNEYAELVGPARSAGKAESFERVESLGKTESLEQTESLAKAESLEKTESLEQTESLAKAESLARAAKRITGFSLDTLNKVSQIRALSTASGVPAELQRAAETGLARLTKSGASVESVYRALGNLQLRLRSDELSFEDAQKQVNETALERLLSDTSLLAERLSGSLSEQVFGAARGSQANLAMLRATRVALTHSLAAVVSLECNLEAAPARALQRIGAEVTHLLAQTSRSRLERFARARQEIAQGEQVAGQFSDRAAA